MRVEMSATDGHKKEVEVSMTERQAKRGPATRHSAEVREAANKRFSEMAMPLTVHKEMGIPYDTVYAWWRAHQGRPIKRKPKARPDGGDPGDEAKAA